MPRRRRGNGKAGAGAGTSSPVKTERHLFGLPSSRARSSDVPFDPRSPIGKKHYRAVFSTGRTHKCAPVSLGDIEAVAGRAPVGAPPDAMALKKTWLLIMSRIETCLAGDIAKFRSQDPDLNIATIKLLAGLLTRSTMNPDELHQINLDAYKIKSNYKFWSETWAPLVNKLQEVANTLKRIGFKTTDAETYIKGLDLHVAELMTRDVDLYDNLITFYGSRAALDHATRGKTLFK